MNEECISRRWEFLDGAGDACAVVTSRMEVVFLNRPARGLVPAGWFGRRCWNVFPVADTGCASRCPAIAFVQEPHGVFYCEETIYPAGGEGVALGVAVAPLAGPREAERALLVLRPVDAAVDRGAFRARLVADAGALAERAPAGLARGEAG